MDRIALGLGLGLGSIGGGARRWMSASIAADAHVPGGEVKREPARHWQRPVEVRRRYTLPSPARPSRVCTPGLPPRTPSDSGARIGVEFSWRGLGAQKADKVRIRAGSSEGDSRVCRRVLPLATAARVPGSSPSWPLSAPAGSPGGARPQASAV
ncbi:hypothetical protein L226DRAFT_91365 [Lentinus tigrinus ALCF2SS1-7]|uniref:Uncharacterized protein n=1 Tax=Lentinus tigrinus ALCF2SS1-6 TaxID=1328759 RepID=A0A5C2RYN2_9APHY|nr:hypothetical protein L227DRAFT_288993 [Lentinus tigrinus ALCF2SS1-6]RPD73946.1 hypothetical protein L226DRAFT_91365 [Lentinus tigrinus ALCF2SS1-7]